MYYICYASRTNSTTKPATRWIAFISDGPTEFNTNLQLAKSTWGKKNILFECVKIRHDGDFHMDVVPLKESGL